MPPFGRPAIRTIAIGIRDRAQIARRSKETMKSLRTISLLAVAATVLFASVAQAAPTVALYIGDENHEAATIKPNTPTPLNIYVEGIDDTIFSVEYKVGLPSDLLVVSNTYYPGALDFGSSANGAAIGIGECISSFQETMGHDPLWVHTITVYSLGFLDATDITVGPYEGYATDPATPRYSDCGGNIKPLDGKGATIAVTSVSNGEDSWGAVKSLY